jgi:hypothetical protein
MIVIWKNTVDVEKPSDEEKLVKSNVYQVNKKISPIFSNNSLSCYKSFENFRMEQFQYENAVYFVINYKFSV